MLITKLQYFISQECFIKTSVYLPGEYTAPPPLLQGKKPSCLTGDLVPDFELVPRQDAPS